MNSLCVWISLSWNWNLRGRSVMCMDGLKGQWLGEWLGWDGEYDSENDVDVYEYGSWKG